VRIDASLARALGVETLGTFALVFFGCGAIMVNANGGGLGEVGIALAFGLVIMAMIYAFGHISGAHLNPAVTLGFAIGRHFPREHVPAYWAAQILGATAAALVLRISLGDVANVGATQPSGSQAQSFLWELVLTATLAIVIMAVATDTRAVGEAAAIAIGGTIGLAALVGGPISGASLNPARSLGPAIASGDTTSLWIYLTAPFVGAVLGVLAYGLVRGKPDVASPAHLDVDRRSIERQVVARKR
jgi:MIP family channel proteins